jgi:hypothetical protein
VQTSGIRDDKLLAIVLRDADGKPIGGAYGWTWGGTCYIRHLFVPAAMREHGLGTLYRPGDAESLVRATKELQDRYAELVAAVAAAQQTLSWDRDEAELIELYRSLGATAAV